MIRTGETRAVAEQSTSHGQPLAASELVGEFMDVFITAYFLTTAIWVLLRSRAVRGTGDERRLIRSTELILGVWALLFVVKDALMTYLRHEPVYRIFSVGITWFDLAVALALFTASRWAPLVSTRFAAWRSRSS